MLGPVPSICDDEIGRDGLAPWDKPKDDGKCPAFAPGIFVSGGYPSTLTTVPFRMKRISRFISCKLTAMQPAVGW